MVFQVPERVAAECAVALTAKRCGKQMNCVQIAGTDALVKGSFLFQRCVAELFLPLLKELCCHLAGFGWQIFTFCKRQQRFCCLLKSCPIEMPALFLPEHSAVGFQMRQTCGNLALRLGECLGDLGERQGF